jgi:hypothetical protein
MFCRKCYADLREASDGKCPKCSRVFDSKNDKTFLQRPFPTPEMIVVQIIATTVTGIFCAFVVALFQITRSSGH